RRRSSGAKKRQFQKVGRAATIALKNRDDGLFWHAGEAVGMAPWRFSLTGAVQLVKVKAFPRLSWQFSPSLGGSNGVEPIHFAAWPCRITSCRTADRFSRRHGRARPGGRGCARSTPLVVQAVRHEEIDQSLGLSVPRPDGAQRVSPARQGRRV